MRQPQNAKRGRGRGRRGNTSGNHNHVPNRNTSYESNGPELKGVNLTLDGSAAITLKSTGTVTVQGSMLQVNGEAMTEIKSSGAPCCAALGACE